MSAGRLRQYDLTRWALIVLGEAAAFAWLDRPNDALDGAAPLNAALCRDGYTAAKALLDGMAYLVNKRPNLDSGPQIMQPIGSMDGAAACFAAHTTRYPAPSAGPGCPAGEALPPIAGGKR